MKSVTEFANFTLTQGLKAKEALTAEGKTPEEIDASLGTTFKLEGDRLKYFVHALDIASQNPVSLRRVLVVSLGEGENAPAKATKIDEFHYVAEFQIEAPRPGAQKADAKGGKGGRGGKGGGRGGKGGGGPKESPWGLSPEQKAAKKAAGSKANKPN